MKARAETCDVAVIGAGTSGVVAALAAARQGARVALVEATDRIGGMAIHGLHRFVCGLFRTGGIRPGELLPGETTIDFCRHLAGGDPAELAVRRGRVWLLPFAGGPALEACATELVAHEPNIRLHMRDRAIHVGRNGARLAEIELVSGTILKTKAAIDCTGSAALCRLAGAQVEWPAHPALAGYGFEVAGVDEAKCGSLGLSLAIPYVLRQEAAAGRLAAHLAFTTWEPAAVPGQGWIKLALPMADGPQARDQADAVWQALGKTPAFARARVLRHLMAPLARETGHLTGACVLTEEDVLTARDFEDAVVHNAWPIELWEENRGVAYRYLPDGQTHGIPLRCLQPLNGPANLLCAGAAISAEPAAAAAIRVMGVCMALGEAAAKRGICAGGA